MANCRDLRSSCGFDDIASDESFYWRSVPRPDRSRATYGKKASGLPSENETKPNPLVASYHWSRPTASRRAEAANSGDLG